MSFLIKNINSKNWIAGFRDSNGIRRNRSTGLIATERNRRKAQQIADEYESAARNKLAAQQVRRTIVSLQHELTGEDMPIVSMRNHVEQWLRSKKTSVAPKTVEFYKGVCDKLFTHLGSKAEKEIGEITREEVEAFRDHLAENLAPKTVNHHVKVLRMLFRDARDRALLLDDPTEFVKTVKNRKVLDRRPFSMDEVRLVLGHCNAEWRSMVLFGLYTGQRLGDISRLKWKSVDLKQKTISLITSKTDKALTIPLPKDLLEHLKSLPTPISGDQAIHLNACTIVEEQGKTGHLSNQFGAILAKAGLRAIKSHKSTGKGRSSKRETNGLSFHSLRRSTATYLHEAGVPQSVAMALIGHDSADIHSIYVNVGQEALKKASKKLPSLKA
ncbi:MAG: tyrosine-type recombinase/integrase [Akkermansiaceae bacterium]|jgi:integrase